MLSLRHLHCLRKETPQEGQVYAPWSIGLHSVEHRPFLHGASGFAPRSVRKAPLGRTFHLLAPSKEISAQKQGFRFLRNLNYHKKTHNNEVLD